MGEQEKEDRTRCLQQLLSYLSALCGSFPRDLGMLWIIEPPAANQSKEMLQ